MTEIINGSLQHIDLQNPSLQSLFHALDPVSLILSQNSDPENPLPLKLTTESFFMERGPRYGAYAQLRESRLRMRNNATPFIESEPEEPERRVPIPPPAKKQVRFQGSPAATGRKGSSILAQSVPDFSAALRKENRKPISRLPSTLEMTPPAAAKNWGRTNGSNLSLRGSKSSSAAEKRGGCGVARKSYANIEELKGLTSAAAKAINGENRAGGRRTVLGSYRPF